MSRDFDSMVHSMKQRSRGDLVRSLRDLHRRRRLGETPDRREMLREMEGRSPQASGGDPRRDEPAQGAHGDSRERGASGDRSRGRKSSGGSAGSMLVQLLKAVHQGPSSIGKIPESLPMLPGLGGGEEGETLFDRVRRDMAAYDRLLQGHLERVDRWLGSVRPEASSPAAAPHPGTAASAPNQGVVTPTVVRPVPQQLLILQAEFEGKAGGRFALQNAYPERRDLSFAFTGLRVRGSAEVFYPRVSLQPPTFELEPGAQRVVQLELDLQGSPAQEGQVHEGGLEVRLGGELALVVQLELRVLPRLAAEP